MGLVNQSQLKFKQEPMKMTKKAIALSLGLVVMGSAAFAQSLADAKKAIDAEQYQKATSMLKALVKSSAKAENFYSLGDVYLRRDYVDSARVAFTQGVTEDAKFPLNYVGLGHADLIDKNTTSAKTNFDKAIDVASRRDYTPYLYIGKAYLALEKPDFAAALPNLEKADEMDEKDKDAETFLALGDYYAMQSKNSDALQKYMMALSIDQNLYRATVQIGRMYKESRAFPDAEMELKNVTEADPNYGPAYRELAELYMQWANQEPQNFAAKAAQALTNYKKYLDLTDNSYESRLRYAQFLFYAKDFQTLETETVELAKMAPSDSKNIFISRLRGYSAFENKNYPQSLQYMKDFFAKIKDTTRLISEDYLYLGKAQLEANEDSLALKNILKAIQMDSTKADALSDVAQSFYDAKNYGKAASTYELANSISPDGKGIGYNLFNEGRAWYFHYADGYNAKTNPSKNILIKADTAFAKLAKLAPGTIETYLWRGRVNNLLDESGEEQKGLKIPHYQQFLDSAEARVAAQYDPAPSPRMMIEAYNNIASYAYFKDDNEKAKLYWDKTLALDPTNSSATEGEKALAAIAQRAATIKKK